MFNRSEVKRLLQAVGLHLHHVAANVHFSQTLHLGLNTMTYWETSAVLPKEVPFSVE